MVQFVAVENTEPYRPILVHVTLIESERACHCHKYKALWINIHNKSLYQSTRTHYIDSLHCTPHKGVPALLAMSTDCLLDELRCALGASEHFRALVGRGELVLVSPVRRPGGKRGGGRGDATTRPLLGPVSAVYLTSLFRHRCQQLLGAFVSWA